jgi:flagellar biosynthesis protein FlhF
MQIHRVQGTSLKDALLRAKDAFGEEAVVMQQELAPGGGVTLSVARRPGKAQPKPAAPIELAEFVPPAIAREVAAKLARTGTSRALIEALCHEVVDWPDPDVHVMDRAAECIGRRFAPVKLAPLARGTRVLAFVGLTGVGKTTTIAKLAVRMLRANRRVELATFDSRRVGAVEQLRAWSKQLGVPLTVLRPGTRPHARALDVSSGAGVDVVLLDTSGSPLADVPAIQTLAQAFAGTRVTFAAHLVLPASASRGTLDLVTRSYAPLAPEAVVITKLDETREPAVALEHALDHQLPVAFLSDGADVSAHLHRAGSEACADLFLRGRLA